MVKRGISPEQAMKIRSEKGLAETKLQKARLKKGYSQNQLSVVSGVTLRAIQSYEQNTSKIDGVRLETICKLCLSLDCKIEDILESKEIIELYRLCK